MMAELVGGEQRVQKPNNTAVARGADVAHLDLVEGLDASVIDDLFGGLSVVGVDAGEQFEISGDDIHCALVATGRLALDYDGAADRHRTVTLVEEGDILLRSHASGPAPKFSVRALGASQLIMVPNTRFERWIANPVFVQALVRQLAAQIADRELAAATALEPRVEHRLLMKIGQLAERFGRATPQGLRLDLRLTHQQLADMVGAVRESVTIAMGRLAASGDLVIDNRTIWIPYRDDPADDAQS
jgi:CRP/FNR family cyclic AMP-dependent transcriptional regulator